MVLKNRIVRSATNDRCADLSGQVTDPLIHVYRSLSVGGTGLIITGHAYVKKDGKRSATMLAADDDTRIPGLKRLVETVHRSDSKIALQINHAGRQTVSSLIGHAPLAPSAIYNPITRELPQALTEDEIEALIDAYAKAALRALIAGFDAIQLHGAHGYLIHQFISPYTNRRTDKWGGSSKNRMRFVLKVLREIRKRVGNSYPILIKLSSEDFFEGGLRVQDSLQVAKALSEEGVDAIEISGGFKESRLKPTRLHILKKKDEAYFLDNARRFRSVIRTPLILVGGLRTPELMENLLENQEIDLVAMCRPLIREPDLPNKWKHGDLKRADCISCGGCHKYYSEPVRCVQTD